MKAQNLYKGLFLDDKWIMKDLISSLKVHSQSTVENYGQFF